LSIYATLWALRFPRFGEFHTACEWVTVFAQGVPAHIGAEGPDWCASFLPPLAESVADDLRAVVFVTEGSAKGTPDSPQQYAMPLLILPGTEYAAMPFAILHAKLCDALRGDRPRLAAEFLRPDGRSTLLYEDGSRSDGPGLREPDSGPGPTPRRERDH
jgi:hypothetical protein